MPTEPAAVPQARRIASDSVSQWTNRLWPAPGRALRSEPVVAGTVNIDYHIAFDTNFYSVPYNLVQQLVEVRSTPTTVEIFHKGKRVASHLRGRGHGHAVTHAEHRPSPSSPSGMDSIADGELGTQHRPNTARLFERILSDKPHPEMGYRSCLGIIRLAQQYSRHAWKPRRNGPSLTGACRYQSVKSILKNSLDVVPP